MGSTEKQFLSFILICCIDSLSLANWKGTLNHSGFFGAYSAGAIYEWRDRHQVELSFGAYPYDNVDYGQTNFAYRYSPWKMSLSSQVQWQPAYFGIFLVHSWDQSHYFMKSPSKYPYEGYYDETALRPGFEWATSFGFQPQKLEIVYSLRIVDGGLIAWHNNSSDDMKFFVSSGVSLQYRF